MTALYKPQTDQKFTRLLDYLALEFSLIHGPWISGGTSRLLWFNEPWEDHDIDIFFRNQQSFERFERLIYPYFGNDLPHITKNATTYTIPFDNFNYKIQCIRKEWHTSIFDIWKTFDFTACCFATDGVTVVADEQAIEDVKNQRLRIVEGSNRGIDGRRVTKYGIYGFEPDRHILKSLLENRDAGTIMKSWASTDEYT